MLKPYQMTLNRVHDTVCIREGNEELTLKVDGDPARMVAGLMEAQKKLRALNEKSTEAENRETALYFAEVIFGGEQAERLAAFYHNDAGCLVMICGKYFSARLSHLITKAQKKQK